MIWQREPPYNHTRDDGPFSPCPQCLERMPPADLRALVRDLQDRLQDAEDKTKEARQQALDE